MSEWSIADILQGKMLVGGPRAVSRCPGCGSPNVKVSTDWSHNQTVRCADCLSSFGGASARQ